MDDIYTFAETINEQWNRYSPQTLESWKKSRLAQFDAEEVGTKAHLEKRRQEYEKTLQTEWKVSHDALWKKQKELMDNFRERLADEFLSMFPESITDLVYRRAWDDGHSSGLSEVINHYRDLAEFVENIIKGHKEAKRNHEQERLLKG